MNVAECVLYSGAANGAEAAFGAAAERKGVEEVNLTFDGHNDARKRGIRVLTEHELQRGDVSLEYVSKLMHGKYRDTPLFKKVLQTIWHQVNSAQETYVVGRILDDGMVKGGTGWGAEYSKLCNKPLFVFVQNEDGGFHWAGGAWEAPVITHPHFAGTGTRFLRENGEAAVAALLDRTFG
jgi:hypothetical protein